jgi:hypothetical protein
VPGLKRLVHEEQIDCDLVLPGCWEIEYRKRSRRRGCCRGRTTELFLEIGGARIRPGRIVVATNAWINPTLPETPPLLCSLTFACVTEPLDIASLAVIGLNEGVPFYTREYEAVALVALIQLRKTRGHCLLWQQAHDPPRVPRPNSSAAPRPQPR